MDSLKLNKIRDLIDGSDDGLTADAGIRSGSGPGQFERSAGYYEPGFLRASLEGQGRTEGNKEARRATLLACPNRPSTNT